MSKYYRDQRDQLLKDLKASDERKGFISGYYACKRQIIKHIYTTLSNRQNMGDKSGLIDSNSILKEIAFMDIEGAK